MHKLGNRENTVELAGPQHANGTQEKGGIRWKKQEYIQTPDNMFEPVSACDNAGFGCDGVSRSMRRAQRLICVMQCSSSSASKLCSLMTVDFLDTPNHSLINNFSTYTQHGLSLSPVAKYGPGVA